MPAASLAALFRDRGGGSLGLPRQRRPRSALGALAHDEGAAADRQAIEEVDAAEKTYLASIEKLSRLAEPALSDATSPVLVNYREKLDVLDSAIAELKSSIEQNRGNTHLRRELLAVYQEKQRTLQSLMKEVKS